MRRFLIPILLASAVASPAYAQRGREDIADRSGGDRGFERRGGNHGNGGEWQRTQRNATPQVSQPQAQPQSSQRRWDGGGRSNGAMTTTPDRTRDRSDGGERRYGWNDRQQQPQTAQPQTNQPPVVREDRDRRWNGERNGNGNWSADRQNNRRTDNDGRWDNNRRSGDDRNWNNNANRDDNRRWGNDRDDDRRGQWNRGWRDDRRYDWRQYRNQNRNYYRMPRYSDPYGYRYGYRRFSIGIFLDDLFFSSRYWLSDPYEYRLPPAYGPYRWVRYYDDVLLVDLRNGRVVDVIYDFFW